MFTIAAASDKLALQTAGNIAFSTLLFGVLIGKMTLSTAIWTKFAIAAAAVVPIPGWVCTIISMKWYPLTKEKMEEPNALEQLDRGLWKILYGDYDYRQLLAQADEKLEEAAGRNGFSLPQRDYFEMYCKSLPAVADGSLFRELVYPFLKRLFMGKAVQTIQTVSLKETGQGMEKWNPKRYEGSLRSYRNSMLTFNTLCRKSVQRAQVHPAHIDELFSNLQIRL